MLEPYRERTEHVALGGDRAAATRVAERLPWLAEKQLERLHVPESRQRELERLPYELYAAEPRKSDDRQPLLGDRLARGAHRGVR